MLSLVATSALAFAPTPLMRPVVTPAVRSAVPTMGVADIFTSVKSSVVPDSTDKTLRNAFGYQALAWGVGGLVAPSYLTANVLGQSATAASNMMMRGASLGNLALAGRFTGGSDAEAATTGFVWFALWTWALRNAARSGAFAGYAATLVTWNAAMALVSARRRGGLWATVSNADTDLLNSVLPRDYERSLRNFVGMQMSAWGVGGLFFADALGKTIGLTSTPFVAALGIGNAITNLVLGGKVMGGSDSAAAANGVVFFGGWAALTYLAKGAGVLTGANLNILILWNALSAAWCAKNLM